MLIGELAKQSNTTKDTIRHYDEKGLLVSHQRQAGSRHYKEYSDENLERIEMIRLAKFMGFTLSEVAQQIEAYYAGDITMEDQVGLLQARMEDVESKIENLQAVKAFLAYKINFVKTQQTNTQTCMSMQSQMADA
jgi:DNA-binding transcriptional MerR regulator